MTRSLRGLLHGLPGSEPSVFAGAALVLAGTALVACLIPALSAARVDPKTTLREG
jgi:putative ABC transport system permease protein